MNPLPSNPPSIPTFSPSHLPQDLQDTKKRLSAAIEAVQRESPATFKGIVSICQENDIALLSTELKKSFTTANLNALFAYLDSVQANSINQFRQAIVDELTSDDYTLDRLLSEMSPQPNESFRKALGTCKEGFWDATGKQMRGFFWYLCSFTKDTSCIETVLQWVDTQNGSYLLHETCRASNFDATMILLKKGDNFFSEEPDHNQLPAELWCHYHPKSDCRHNFQQEFTALLEQALGAPLTQEKLDALFLELLAIPNQRDTFAVLFFEFLALGCNMDRVATTYPNFWNENERGDSLVIWLNEVIRYTCDRRYESIFPTIVPYLDQQATLYKYLWEKVCERGLYLTALEFVRRGEDPLQKHFYTPHLCKLFTSSLFYNYKIENIAELLSLHLDVSPHRTERVKFIFENIFSYEAVLPAFIRVLQQEKFDFNALNSKGMSLLHNALAKSDYSEEVVKNILSCGTDWLVENSEGRRAISVLFSPECILSSKKSDKVTSLYCGNLLEHAVARGANSPLQQAISGYDQKFITLFLFLIPSDCSELLLTFLVQMNFVTKNPFICSQVIADQIERLHGSDTAKKLLTRIDWENEAFPCALIEVGKQLENDLSIASRERYLRFLLQHAPSHKKLFQDELTALRKRMCATEYQKTTPQSKWPCFEQMVSDIGFHKTTPPTPEQVAAIETLSSTLLDKYLINWSVTLHHIGKISHKWLKQHCKAIELSLRSGETLTAYQTEDMPLLAHFTTIVNACAILRKEILAQDLPFIRARDDYFWNSQEKISTSLITDQRYSFFSAHGEHYGKGIGFVIHVPDSERSLIHAFPNDAWSPSFVSDGITAIAQSNPREDVQQHNALMYRHRAIASYVYSMYLAAKHIHLRLGNELATEPLIPDFTTGTLEIERLDELPLVKMLDTIQSLCADISVKPNAPSQQQLFQFIFNREATQEENIENALHTISTHVKQFFDTHRETIVTKTDEDLEPFDPKALLSRPFSPHELLAATPDDRCSEICVRAWPSCRAIGSKGPSFKAIILESFYFKTKHLSAQVEEILLLADKAGLPIIYLNSPQISS